MASLGRQRNCVQEMDSKPNIHKGSKVWVEDREHAWVEAEVLSVSGMHVFLVTVFRSKVSASLKQVLLRDPDTEFGGVDDMTKLAYLNEPGVLHNLVRRYALNDIYTYTGSILIAVNPFTKLPHLYNVHMMEQYKGKPLGELSHVFSVADAAYRAMMNEGRNQSILVSGESGAGKTETTKLIMQYLTYVGGCAAGDDRTVEQQVLESNPLLEAFGNAKTVWNDNSSRFGKFVEIQFDKSGRISGAAIRTYLLERSRVVQITDLERNYHCFYQLCASGKVVAQMREIVSSKDCSDFITNSFLLDDDLRYLIVSTFMILSGGEDVGFVFDAVCILFSAEDLSQAIPSVDPEDVEMPSFLHEIPSLHLLQH